MSKFKIEHGASKVNFVLLKTNVEDSIAHDINLMAEWSNNDRRYLVNELLRFALAQEEDFQKYKAGLGANVPMFASSTNSAPPSIKAVSDPQQKSEPQVIGTAARP
jgi:hypothetical protein